MSSKVRLDPIAITQIEHDPSKGAKKVSIVDADIAMELNADDGDSVQTQGRVFEYSPETGDEMDITACGQIKVYSTGPITVEISPDIAGETFKAVGTYTDDSPILDVLARRLRVTSGSSIKVLGRG